MVDSADVGRERYPETVTTPVPHQYRDIAVSARTVFEGLLCHPLRRSDRRRPTGTTGVRWSWQCLASSARRARLTVPPRCCSSESDFPRGDGVVTVR